MKTRTMLFLSVVSVMTGSTLLLGAAGADADKAARNSDSVSVTEQAAQAKPVKLSFGVDEIVKMNQGGVEADVLVNYVENSNVPYHLSAEDIVSLHDQGVPSQVITTMIRHGAKMQQQAALAYQQSQQKATEDAKAASAYANTSPSSVYYPPLAPAVNYNYTYPEYAYAGYPAYYSYPSYCYSSPFYFSFGYPGYRHFSFFGGFRSFPRFGFGGHIGSGHAGFSGGFHNGRHR